MSQNQDPDRAAVPDSPPLPQEEFPGEELSTVVDERADGSRRCVFYREDVDPVTAETSWLAVDEDTVVSISDWR
ncbi:DUF7511 domain-containing protein [Halomicrobium salinisoli]|uniref:DUF7511 domain-containing protein n=1 Tax=Halomicrobium salinisoli TaxID=2878391 RepID=UPI001CEFE9B1|nr:hypothetical protein [Halomicrobium salinisoli]